MRFAAVSLALCAAATAIPLDTSSVSGLSEVGTVEGLVPDTSDLGVRQIPDTSSVTDIADLDSITGETSDLGVRDIVNEVTDTSSDADPLISILGAAPINTRSIVQNGGFPTEASPDSGLLEDLILEVRHIRFAVVKGIKDELKDIDPSLGKEVSQIINELNRTERQLFKDVGLPGNLYNKLMIVIGEINSVVKTIEGGLIGEGTIVDPSIGSLIAQLLGDVNSLVSNVEKTVGVSAPKQT